MLEEQHILRTQRRQSFRTDIENTCLKLNDFIDNVNDKIVDRIQLVAQVYMEDYKKLVKTMTEELREIRKALDEELLKQRANQRLFFLEEERDFFRSQVIKLNEELVTISKSNTKLKEILEETKAQSENYKTLVTGLQRKILKIQNQAFQAQKLKQVPVASSLPAFQSKMLSTSPTRPTLTRYYPVQSTTLRTAHKSVELKRRASSHFMEGEVKRKEEILQECIKDVKKKIFYRTINPSESRKFHFDEYKKIPFEKFTRTDKQDLVQSILADPQLLQQLYSFMTTSKDNHSPLATRVGKFHSNKVALSDKIFKIKLYGTSRN